MPRSHLRISSKNTVRWIESQRGAVAMSEVTRPSCRGGGDFHLTAPIDAEYHAIAVGEVSGPGGKIADLAPTVRGLLREQLRCYRSPDPTPTLLGLNAILHDELPVDHFVTLVLGILHRPSGALRLVRAGGSPPLFLTRAGEVEVLEPEGIALGLDPGPLFHKSLSEVRVIFRDGESLLLHSDGLTRACRNDGDDFGLQRLAAALSDCPREYEVEALREEILSRLSCFLGGRQPEDDVTLICLRHHPSATPPLK